MAKSGVSFHWDKDEDLRLLCGGSMYIHPHLSTVTYLTDIGAPTMVLSKRVNPMTGENVIEEVDTTGMVCWPKRGKHLSFDGRYLHAAPSDLMEDGMFDRQTSFNEPKEMRDKERKVQQRRHRRVTFLVNIWLNYKPFNVNPFPETMLNSLSDVDSFGEFKLFEDKKNTSSCMHQEGIVVTLDSEMSAEVTRMTWPMGSCDDDEQVEVPIPVGVARKQASSGSNVHLVWRPDLVRLQSSKK
jgi:hypothetical protein